MASNPQKVTQTAINDTIGLTAVLFQNTARLLDIQAQATRSLLQNQARNASAIFGTPDLSESLNNAPEHLFETSAQRTVDYLRQTNEVVSQLQSQIKEFVEQRSTEIANNVQENIQQSMEQLQQTQQEAAQKSKDVVKDTADSTERAARNQPQQPQGKR